MDAMHDVAGYVDRFVLRNCTCDSGCGQTRPGGYHNGRQVDQAYVAAHGWKQIQDDCPRDAG